MPAGRRLRIAVLSRHFVHTGGGAERYAIALVEELATQHEVHVFAQRIDHQCPGVRYHRLGFHLRRPRWINQLGFAITSWWATRKGFDVVHSHENVWHGNLQTVHVLSVRHSLFFGKSGLALCKQYLKVATSLRLLSYLWLEKCRYTLRPGGRVVAVSEPLRQSMLQAYPGVRAALDVVALFGLLGFHRAFGVDTAETRRKARTAMSGRSASVTPVRMICTPMHSSRKAVSLVTMRVPCGPMRRAIGSA
jgi:UDP-glucose:(heptosyl)LPS alpha-1,3-glucosyltransferase